MSQVVYQEPYASRYRGDRYNTGAAYRSHPHRGQDWAPGDAPVIAIADGIVQKVYPLSASKVLGNVVVVKHADGVFAGYCHLASLSGVKAGMKVSRGKQIGKARLGSTGSAATGRHLHLTLSTWAEGVFYAPAANMKDPLAWILAHVAAKVVTASATKAAESKDKANVKKVAKYLNARSKKLKLGRTTTSDKDGIRGSNFYWLLQTIGRLDGIYGKAFKIDGKTGPMTRKLDAHYLTKA